jgi:hypothetical protein
LFRNILPHNNLRNDADGRKRRRIARCEKTDLARKKSRKTPVSAGSCRIYLPPEARNSAKCLPAGAEMREFAPKSGKFRAGFFARAGAHERPVPFNMRRQLAIIQRVT